jgi:protein tyrosine phosphatase (PTP) superfamily phosphohydrolase (DUF442 family)
LDRLVFSFQTNSRTTRSVGLIALLPKLLPNQGHGMTDVAAQERHAVAPSGLRRRVALGVVALAIFVVVCGGVWRFVLRDRLIAKRFGVVVPGLVFRSGQISRHRIESVLTTYRIRCVIDLQGDDSNSPEQQAERETVKRLGIRRVSAPLIGDGTGEVEQYAVAVAELVRCRDAGEPVLVHCSAGSQRTGGVVAAYRLLIEGVSQADVLREMQRYDWNPRRDRILPQYLDRNLPELGRRLNARGIATVKREFTQPLAGSAGAVESGPRFLR